MPKQLTTYAKTLRNNPTLSEKKLWSRLKNRQLLNYRFNRQAVIGHFIVDFVCKEQKLVIELDGGQHVEQLDYDSRRTSELKSRGYQVIRFWNNDVMCNLEDVLQSIVNALQPSP